MNADAADCALPDDRPKRIPSTCNFMLPTDWERSFSLEDEGRSCVFSLGDSRLTSVRWNLKLVDWLVEEITSSGEDEQQQEVGGVLLGTVKEAHHCGHVIELRLTLFVPIACSHRSGPLYHLSDEVELAVRNRLSGLIKHSPWSVVGFYRSQLRPGLELDDEDEMLAHKYFTGPAHLFMLISPHREGGAVGTLFVGGHGQVSKVPVLSFPFDARKLSRARRKATSRPGEAGSSGTGHEAGVFEKLPHQTAITGSSGERRLLKGGQIAGIRRGLKWGTAICVVCLVFVISMARIHIRKRDNAPAAVPTVAKLGLAGFVELDHIRLKWNPVAPAIISAATGSLLVEDGDFHNSIPLTSFALRHGTAVYFPLTGSPTFELRVGPMKEGITVLGFHSASSSDRISSFRQRFDRSVSAPPKTQVRSDLKEQSEAARLSYPSIPILTVEANISRQVESPTAVMPLVPPDISFSTRASVPVDLNVFSEREPRLTYSVPPAISSNTPETSDASKQLPRKSVEVAISGPQVVRQVRPQVSNDILKMLITEQTIDVRVNLNEKGQVVNATVVSQKGSLSGLLTLASLNAARHWSFKPARRGDQSIPCEHTISFVFSPAR